VRYGQTYRVILFIFAFIYVYISIIIIINIGTAVPQVCMLVEALSPGWEYSWFP
jgi:hypothetical protein